MMNKAGIYVHIPFCVSKCQYCDFVSFAGREDRYEAYKRALLDEIASCDELRETEIKTIFIGGGTPTVFPYLTDIIEALTEYKIIRNAEITVEANPGTISPPLLSSLRAAGVNRLSIGLQTWQDRLLRSLGRIHDLKMFLESYENAVAAGFDNINIDLMFGIYGQTYDDWRQTLDGVAGLKPAHISAYGLIIEENTPYGKLLDKGEITLFDEASDREMYYFLRDYLNENHYEQYEISNFARQEKTHDNRCLHNIGYWERDDYLGFGLNAHSFYDGVRYSNTTSLDKYLSLDGNRNSITENKLALTRDEAIEEYMFLGLRMTNGISIQKFGSIFSDDIFNIYGDTINGLICEGLLAVDGDRLYLTPRGVDISNMVFVRFLYSS